MDGTEEGRREGCLVGVNDGWELGEIEGSEVSLTSGWGGKLGEVVMLAMLKVGASVAGNRDGDKDGGKLGPAVTEMTVLF